MNQEQKHSDYTAFSTLTYSDEYLPKMRVGTHEFAVGDKKDVQDFLKRYRKRLKLENITLRYYCAQEYGERTRRPHYHFMLFFKGVQNDFQRLYCLNAFRESWNFGDVSDFQQSYTQGAYGYVSGYLLSQDNGNYLKYRNQKKYEGEKVFLSKRSYIYEFSKKLFPDDKKLQFLTYLQMMYAPEWSLKSQGLGRDYIEEYATQHCYDVSPPTQLRLEDGVKIQMPRYFRRKLFGEETLSDIQLYELQQKQVSEREQRYNKARIEYIRSTGSDIGFEQYYNTDLSNTIDFLNRKKLTKHGD